VDKVANANFPITMPINDQQVGFADEIQGAFNAKFSHFENLRDNGRVATENWLAESFEDIGKKSSFDLKGMV